MSTTLTAPTPATTTGSGLARRRAKLTTQQQMAALHLDRLPDDCPNADSLARRVTMIGGVDPQDVELCQDVDRYVRMARTLLVALHDARGHDACVPG